MQTNICCLRDEDIVGPVPLLLPIPCTSLFLSDSRCRVRFEFFRGRKHGNQYHAFLTAGQSWSAIKHIQVGSPLLKQSTNRTVSLRSPAGLQASWLRSSPCILVDKAFAASVYSLRLVTGRWYAHEWLHSGIGVSLVPRGSSAVE